MAFLCIRTYAFLILLFVFHALAEPVQFCKSGAQQHPEAVDFCVSLSAQENQTSQSHDVFLALSITRPPKNAQGWTAIGVGPEMKGSLMFVIYGDASSSVSPTVSIRTVDGHVPPEPVSVDNVHFDVIQSAWKSGDASVVANVLIACYSCTSWTGSTLSVKDTSQPWIWAWNTDQVFQDFSDSVTLQAHSHLPEEEGTGHFYVDMARALVDEASPNPSVQPNLGSIGTSEELTTESGKETVLPKKGMFAWNVHGLSMALAFLVLFPAGIVGIRMRSSRAFKYHWIPQLIGTLVVLAAAALGFVKSHRIDTPHQIIGIGIAFILGLQAVLGWRQHIIFVHSKRRGILSLIHQWLGRAVLLLGGYNLMTGALLAGFGKVIFMGLMMVEMMEGMMLASWIRSSGQRQSKEAENGQPGWDEELEDYFVLEDNESNDGINGDDEGGDSVKKVDDDPTKA